MRNESMSGERHLRGVPSRSADQEAIRQAIAWAKRCEALDLSPEMRGVADGLVRQLTLLVLTRRYA